MCFVRDDNLFFTLQSNCEVNMKNRRKCPRCRYELCLRAGMRPDLVLTQEEKETRFRKFYQKRASLNKSVSAESADSAGDAASSVGIATDVDQTSESPVSPPPTAGSTTFSPWASGPPPTDDVLGEILRDHEVKQEAPDEIILEPEEEQQEAPSHGPPNMSDERLLELCLSEVDTILKDCEQSQLPGPHQQQQPHPYLQQPEHVQKQILQRLKQQQQHHLLQQQQHQHAPFVPAPLAIQQQAPWARALGGGGGGQAHDIVAGENHYILERL